MNTKSLAAPLFGVVLILLTSSSAPAAPVTTIYTDNDSGNINLTGSWSDDGNWNSGAGPSPVTIVNDGNTAVVQIGTVPLSGAVLVDNPSGQAVIDSLTFNASLTGSTSLIPLGGQTLLVNGAITNLSTFNQTLGLPVFAGASATYAGGTGGLTFGDLTLGTLAGTPFNIQTTGAVTVTGNLGFIVNSNTAGGFSQIGPTSGTFNASNANLVVTGTYTGAVGDFFQLVTGTSTGASNLTGVTLDTTGIALPSSLTFVTSLINKGILFVEPSATALTNPGATVINAGVVLPIGNDTEFNGTGTAIILNGGELLTSNDNGSLDTGGTPGAAFSTSRPIQLNAVAGNTIAANATTTATYSGIISDATGSPGPLTIGDAGNSGTGIVVFNVANTYTGATTINGGTLTLGAGGSLVDSSGINLANSGTTFDISAGSQTIQDLTGVAGSTVNLGAHVLTAGTANSTMFAGVIQGTGGSLTKVGAGILTLSGANTFSGATTINVGAVNIQSSSALGTGAGTSTSGVTVAGGAALQIQGGISTTTAVGLTLNGTGLASKGALENVSGANTYSGLITLASASTIGSDAGTLNLSNAGAIIGGGFGLTLTGSGSGTLAGAIDTTTSSVTKTGNGSWTLSGANSYTGGTTINAGTLVAGSASALGAATGGLTDSGTLDLNANSVTVGAFSGGGTVTSGTAGAAGLTVGGAGTFSGAIQDGSGTVSLVKNGGGTLTLSGANTYTGPTTVNAGTLALSGTGSLGATTVSVGGGATLAATGASNSIGGGISLSNNGTIDLQNSATNALNAATLTVVSGTGTLAIDVGSGGTDSVGLTGAAALGAGSLTVNIASAAGAAAGTPYTFLSATGGGLAANDFTGNLTGNFAGDSLTFSVNMAGTMAFFQINAGANNYYFSGATSSDFTLAANFNTDATTNIAQTNAPSSTSDVFIGTSTPTPMNLPPTLGTDLTINSLTFTPSGSGTTLSGTGGTLTIDAGVTLQTGVSSATISAPVALGGSQTWTVTDAASTLTDSGGISGAFGLTKAGAGTLVFSGANGYTGATTISAGVVNIQNNSALGTGAGASTSGVTVASGAALQIQGNISTTTAVGLTLNGTGLAGNGALENVSGANTYSGLITLASDSTIGSDSGTLTLSNTGTITGSGFNLTLTGSGGGTVAGIIGTGAGSVTKTGTGIWTFSGVNTYSGGTTISGGELQLSGAGTLGATTGALNVAGATLNLNGTAQTVGAVSITAAGSSIFGGTLNGASFSDTVSSGAATVSAILGGPGGLTLSGASTLTLTGANTYSGGTTISAGTLDVSGSGTLGAAAGNLTMSGGTLNLGSTSQTAGVVDITGASTIQNGTLTGTSYSDSAPSGTTTVSAILGGSGGLTLSGASTLALSGANTYSGGTTISAGTLDVSGSGTLGATSGALNLSGGTLDLGGTSQMVGVVGITGASTIQNGTLTGTSYSDSAASGTVTVSAALGGSGGLTKSGASTLALSGANTYSGGTTISAGTLDVSGSGTLGTTTNDLTISGGTLDLGGTPQMVGVVGVTGASTIQNGTLTGTSYSVSAASGAVTVTANLAGAGGLTKSGASTLTLSGANSYSGGTTINSGTVLAGSSTALGTGFVTNTSGTLGAAGANHVITVATNYIQGGGGTLNIHLTSLPGTNPGVNDTNDVLSVGGTASLGGQLALTVIPSNTFTPATGQSFVVVEANTTTPATANGITTVGTGFTTGIASVPGLTITGTLSNNNNDLLVTFTSTQMQLTSIPGVVYTPNQAAIANYISANITSGPLFDLLAAVVANNPQELPAIQDQFNPGKVANFARNTIFNGVDFSIQLLDGYFNSEISPQGDFLGGNGQIDSSALTVFNPSVDPGLAQVSSRLMAWNPAPLPRGLLSDSADPVMAGVDMKEMKPAPAPEKGPDFHVFVAGDVVLAQNFSQPDLAHSDTTTGAVQLGADYRITPHLRAGALFGFSHTDADLDTNGSKATVDSYSPGAFVCFADSGWYLNAVGSYGFNNFTEDRHMSIDGASAVAHGAPGGDQIVGDLDGGYDFHVNNWTLGPLAGVQYTHLDVDSYTEDGAQALDANMTVHKQEADSLRSRVGGHVSYLFQTGKAFLTPHLDASWQHEFMDQSQGISAQFTSPTVLGGAPFTVTTPNPSRESALIDCGLTADLDGQVSLYLDYLVQAGQSNYFAQAVQAGVKVGF